MNEMPNVTPPVSLKVGDEPAKFLTDVRYVINSEQSGEPNCKSIFAEEKIISLDSNNKQSAERPKCLDITKPLANDSSSDNNNSITEARSLSPVLQEATVFSVLQSYMYFDSLTTANIEKYKINNQASLLEKCLFVLNATQLIVLQPFCLIRQNVVGV